MITSYSGDIFKSHANIIVHQANIYVCMGAGIAYTIKHLYPEAFEADRATKYADRSKLGTYSFAKTSEGKVIINLYSQTGIGRNGCHTDYDYMRQGLEKIRDDIEFDKFKIEKPVLGIPYGIGCGLAGGSIDIVEPLVNEVFAETSYPVIFCSL